MISSLSMKTDNGWKLAKKKNWFWNMFLVCTFLGKKEKGGEENQHYNEVIMT